MENQAFLTINGYILCPSAMSYTRSALDDGDSSYRDANGKLQRVMIRSDIEKLELTFYSADLTNEIVSDLLHATEPAFFKVKFFSPYEGKFVERTMYAGDKVLTAYRYDTKTGRVIWQDITFSLISQ